MSVARIHLQRCPIKSSELCKQEVTIASQASITSKKYSLELQKIHIFKCTYDIVLFLSAYVEKYVFQS